MPRARHLLILAGLWASCLFAAQEAPFSNHISPERTLLVLATPSASDRYYRRLRPEILAFQTATAKQVLGRDNIVILGDRKTLKQLAMDLPEDILLEAPMRDIWMRDFTPVVLEDPILFRYTSAAQAGKQPTADWVQGGFVRFARKLGLSFRRTRLMLDGGNVVENGIDKAIVTDRFLSDNALSKPKALFLLQKELDVERVAILPADPEDPLAHADGMALFLGSNTVAVTAYGGTFQSQLKQELSKAFPGIRILELETEFDTGKAWDPRFGSAKGITVNAVRTDRFLYVPVFGVKTDATNLELIRAESDREVIPIDAGTVSRMGGSVRCLSGQMKGENARKLIEAARKP
jgi:agmatine/peptidylarginine deiminase